MLKYNPLSLVIDQTVLCNEKCFFCWRADSGKVAFASDPTNKPWNHLPWEIYTAIIDDASQYPNLTNLSMCGPMGDPTLVPDLELRGMYASQHFKTRLINTNGVALDQHSPTGLLRSTFRLTPSGLKHIRQFMGATILNEY